MATKKTENETPKTNEKAPVTLKEIKIIKKANPEPIVSPTEEELAELSKVANIIETTPEDTPQEEEENDDDSLKIVSEFDENGFEFKRIKLSRPCRIPSRGEGMFEEVIIKTPSLQFLINNPVVLDSEFINSMVSQKITPETIKMAFHGAGLKEEDYELIPLKDGMMIVMTFLTFLGK